jgi:hypothetical protein
MPPPGARPERPAWVTSGLVPIFCFSSGKSSPALASTEPTASSSCAGVSPWTPSRSTSRRASSSRRPAAAAWARISARTAASRQPASLIAAARTTLPTPSLSRFVHRESASGRAGAAGSASMDHSGPPAAGHRLRLGRARGHGGSGAVSVSSRRRRRTWRGAWRRAPRRARSAP